MNIEVYQVLIRFLLFYSYKGITIIIYDMTMFALMMDS